MPSESVKISDTVQVVSDSPQRVALDLAFKIADFDDVSSREKDRMYWLKLYCQCHQIIKGTSVDVVLSETKMKD